MKASDSGHGFMKSGKTTSTKHPTLNPREGQVEEGRLNKGTIDEMLQKANFIYSNIISYVNVKYILILIQHIYSSNPHTPDQY